MTLVLDSTFLIDLSHKHAGARSLMAQLRSTGETLLVPAVVMYEYLVNIEDQDIEIRKLEAGCHIEEVTIADFRRASSIGRALKKDHKFPGFNDVLIAAFAERHGKLPIVTRNARDFPLSQTMTY